MSEENKAIARSMTDAFAANDVGKLESLLSRGFVDHNPMPGSSGDVEGLKQNLAVMHGGFSGMRVAVQDQVAEGDKVATRWIGTATHTGEFMGIPASGKAITVEGYMIDRIAGGKIAEHWKLFDAMTLM